VCVLELIDCVDDPSLSDEQQADVLPVAGICHARGVAVRHHSHP
jgi:hypothetical protein